jgi:hypothetical protein
LRRLHKIIYVNQLMTAAVLRAYIFIETQAAHEYLLVSEAIDRLRKRFLAKVTLGPRVSEIGRKAK